MDTELEELIQSLEQGTNWDGRRLVYYDGFWCPVDILRPILSAQKHFKANDTDIMLATMPKSGTTWLKALTFCVANRNIYTVDQSPLLTSNPHNLVPFMEYGLYFGQDNPDLQRISSPRIFSTHVPFNNLPESILGSDCKIIYVCRNPLDLFISNRHYLLENNFGKDAVPLGLEEAFDLFGQGVYSFGPFWEHMLGYWNAHKNNPHKLLFLKYEDLKEDITSHVKRIAEFLGFPFSKEEEEQGLIDQISSLCSFERLSSLEANKSGFAGSARVSSFFRKGEVGDWRNYLTPAMATRIKDVMETEWKGSGLMFNGLN